MQSELAHDVSTVRLGGLDADPEHRSHFFTALAFGPAFAGFLAHAQWNDKTTISVLGRILCICRAASNPFKSGMAMSITTISGLCCSAMAMASRPVAASAQISQPGRDDRKA